MEVRVKGTVRQRPLIDLYADLVGNRDLSDQQAYASKGQWTEEEWSLVGAYHT